MAKISPDPGGDGLVVVEDRSTASKVHRLTILIYHIVVHSEHETLVNFTTILRPILLMNDKYISDVIDHFPYFAGTLQERERERCTTFYFFQIIFGQLKIGESPTCCAALVTISTTCQTWRVRKDLAR